MWSRASDDHAIHMPYAARRGELASRKEHISSSNWDAIDNKDFYFPAERLMQLAMTGMEGKCDSVQLRGS